MYKDEYLRLPTEADVKAVTRLHKNVHGVDGMFGSLDCMHTYWNKCPVAWQGSYKGKGHKPSIVLEAIADHHLWFWHASYGYAGTLNDINILNLSPFLESLLDGEFEKLESTSVPFAIGQEVFNQLFILVDGIYPRYSRFVKGMKEPVTEDEKTFTEWQEAARKDIERAFGVLQGKFQALATPIVLLDLKIIADLCSSSLILHNMCVSDRIMGDVRARYDPAYNLLPEKEVEIEYSEEFLQKKERMKSAIGISNSDSFVQKLVLRKDRWRELVNLDEFVRLHSALYRYLSKSN